MKTKIRLESTEIDSVNNKLMMSVRKRMPSSSFKHFDRAMRYSFVGGMNSQIDFGSTVNKSVYQGSKVGRGGPKRSDDRKSKSMSKKKSKKKLDAEDEAY
jgi:hypothetical protein